MRLWVVLSDIQIPFQDQPVLNLVLNFIHDLQPHGILLNGDIVDCLVPGTRVLTEDLQWKDVASLGIGDSLVGFDEEPKGKTAAGRRRQRYLRKTTVTGTVAIRQPVWRLILSSGETLSASVGHKWLGWKSKKARAVQEWMSTAEIAKRALEDRPVLLHRPVMPWKTEKDWSSGYLRAAFEGEGHITFHKQANNFGHLAFSQKPGSFLDNVESELKCAGFATRRVIRPDTMTQLTVSGGMWEQARFIGTYRPPRFVRKWLDKAPMDQAALIDSHRASVVGAEFLGEQWVISLRTTSKTLLAEGFSSHNCYAISDYDKDPMEKAGLQKEIDEAGKLMGKLARVNSLKERIWLEGNHEDRLRRLLWRTPQLADLQALSFKKLFRLPDYGFSHYPYGRHWMLGKLMVTHGFAVRTHSGISARAHFDRLGTSCLIGHTHRLGAFYKTNVRGQHVAYENGCLCRLDPKYVQYPDWQAGFSVVHVDEGGFFNVQQIPILNRKCFFYGGTLVGKR